MYLSRVITFLCTPSRPSQLNDLPGLQAVNWYNSLRFKEQPGLTIQLGLWEQAESNRHNRYAQSGLYTCLCSGRTYLPIEYSQLGGFAFYSSENPSSYLNPTLRVLPFLLKLSC